MKLWIIFSLVTPTGRNREGPPPRPLAAFPSGHTLRSPGSRCHPSARSQSLTRWAFVPGLTHSSLSVLETTPMAASGTQGQIAAKCCVPSVFSAGCLPSHFPACTRQPLTWSLLGHMSSCPSIRFLNLLRILQPESQLIQDSETPLCRRPHPGCPSLLKVLLLARSR